MGRPLSDVNCPDERLQMFMEIPTGQCGNIYADCSGRNKSSNLREEKVSLLFAPLFAQPDS